MTPKLPALLCLMVGLLAAVPSARAREAEIWIYANLTASWSLVSGYAQADLVYPCPQCDWGYYEDCWWDYDIMLDVTLSLDYDTVKHAWQHSQKNSAWRSVSQASPSPGSWQLYAYFTSSVAWNEWYNGEDGFYWQRFENPTGEDWDSDVLGCGDAEKNALIMEYSRLPRSWLGGQAEPLGPG